jgi:hypothetical protein
MENNKLYEKAFTEAFGVNWPQLSGLTYQSTPLWDSVGHMNLVAILEDSFDIMMETDDIK